MKFEFKDKQEINPEEVQQAMEIACNQIIENLSDFTFDYPNSYSINNYYQPIKNVEWTNGFWTGEIWLAYEYTKDRRLRESAEIQIEEFRRRIVNQEFEDYHHLGLLYSLSCVSGYKLTENMAARDAAVRAAEQQLTRYQPVGEFIQAKGPMNHLGNYSLIIDSLLNQPLLYWASVETRNHKFREIADKHIKTTLGNVIREDFSTWSSFYFNCKTGVPAHGVNSQGYKADSPWTRGQAFGIYGTALAYKYTRRKEYIAYFRGIVNFYMKHLAQDLIPYWDLGFGDGADEPKDSSSASITACGLLEMAPYFEEEEAKYYRGIASKIMKSLWENYAVKKPGISNGLVLHGTYSRRSPYNECEELGVDECSLWGDYFYLEALTRLYRNWDSYL